MWTTTTGFASRPYLIRDVWVHKLRNVCRLLVAKGAELEHEVGNLQDHSCNSFVGWVNLTHNIEPQYRATIARHQAESVVEHAAPRNIVPPSFITTSRCTSCTSPSHGVLGSYSKLLSTGEGGMPCY